jgi:hypothetical protein
VYLGPGSISALAHLVTNLRSFERYDQSHDDLAVLCRLTFDADNHAKVSGLVTDEAVPEPHKKALEI